MSYMEKHNLYRSLLRDLKHKERNDLFDNTVGHHSVGIQ